MPNASQSPNPAQPVHADAPQPRGATTQLDREVTAIKDRLMREATAAVGMVEGAVEALWKLDMQTAGEIRQRDKDIDQEEVAIEAACLRVMTLMGPMARDLRELAFMLKVNADIERVADHACSIAKVVRKYPKDAPPAWPTALRELGERVPIVCQSLLRALRDEDTEAAKQIVIGDEVIDALHRRLFDETLDMMHVSPSAQAGGLLVYRVGRDLERIADLMTNIAEDIVFLRTGQIIRHAKKRLRNETNGAAAE